jgi:hypothetical protein
MNKHIAHRLAAADMLACASAQADVVVIVNPAAPALRLN